MKSYWLVVVVVESACFVHTVSAPLFTDAATVTDDVRALLKHMSIVPESLTITGPYQHIKLTALPELVSK